MRDENVVLRLEGICKEFPGVKALQNVEFTLHKGEIHALMGENGAGKSTLIKVLTGVYEKDGGDIYMSDNPEPVIIRSTQDAQKAGISTVYQEITLCPNLTVAENIGLNPRLIRIAAGIATAVPNPAIASSNPPNPQVSSNT